MSKPQNTLTRSLTAPAQNQSVNERLDEIFETGRIRAEAMGLITPQSPRSNPSNNTNRPLSSSSVDETTVLSPSSHSNYQTAHLAYSSSGVSPLESRRRTGFGNRLEGDAEGERMRGGNSSLSEEEREGEGEKKFGVWDAILETFKPVELENKGSVARDHLAIERTFLAWLRTSLAFASIGIAITQLFRLNTTLREDPESSSSSAPIDSHLLRIRHMGKPLGATFLGLSIVMLLLGYTRYSMTTAYVMRGKFPASRATVLGVASATFGLMVTSLVVVVLVHPKIKKI